MSSEVARIKTNVVKAKELIQEAHTTARADKTTSTYITTRLQEAESRLASVEVDLSYTLEDWEQIAVLL